MSEFDLSAEVRELRNLVDSPGWKIHQRMVDEEIEERRRQNADVLEDMDDIRSNRAINSAALATLRKTIHRAYAPVETQVVG
jgi:hypothetical protein